ncbi:soluble lytic murein transglycosylase [Thermosipho japonicus]|uniref:Soluble lytic murein transglycosylase n=1 Tax=Thermosipho japonicus TaxID=90323 RepID=A0A841GEA1_9BACT|nr:soluble lytic murein transglycosylase [Thermosipho japonicus]
MDEKIEEYIEETCIANNVDPDLVKAIIMTESGGNTDAESYYARGLMQISKIALKEINDLYRLNLTWDDMFNPYHNISIGVLYLKRLIDYFITKYPYNPFSVNFAIMAYNFGIGMVNQWLRNTKPDNRFIDEYIPKETRDHLLDVMWWYTYFRNRKIDK